MAKGVFEERADFQYRWCQKLGRMSSARRYPFAEENELGVKCISDGNMWQVWAGLETKNVVNIL